MRVPIFGNSHIDSTESSPIVVKRTYAQTRPCHKTEKPDAVSSKLVQGTPEQRTCLSVHFQDVADRIRILIQRSCFLKQRSTIACLVRP